MLLRTEFVARYFPDETEPGVLYISRVFQLAIHRCPCGCGHEVVTPLAEGGWMLSLENGEATLQPSILNRSECKSHYFIVRNHVQWT